MEILKQYPVLDTDDVDAEADFWAAVLGGTAEPDFQSAAGGWRTIVVDGREVLGIQLAPDHVRPQWPDGPQHQQMHLDLYIADLEDAHAEITGLGAELLQPAEDPAAARGFQVYADPAGHPFCLCWG
ncbi:VOC family protein [Kocuria palustris]|uniref:VOC family protein n=1 Tax=Kocuria palustris TaxID=71999 RepID=UPI000738D7BF|nr:VOC family protein [Kocuria palustris]KUG56973.1 glyoxalase [Kocuria palustris]MBM7823454.1 putative enzyme related to lactoylglutathione lyase [Kocuria palustris]